MNDTITITSGLGFTPIYSASAIFLTGFTLLLVLQLVFAVRFWHFYGYAIGMVCGLLLEMLGYVAKLQLSRNQQNKNAYIM